MKDLTLADLCTLVVDCKNRTPPGALPGEDIAGFAIGTPNIVNGRIQLSDAKPVSREAFETWTARAIPQAGDIVLTREAPVGRVGRVEDGMRLCLGQRTMLLRPNERRADSRFLHYFLLSPHIQGLLHAQASGSTVAHLRVGQVRDLRIPRVPEVAEQHRIGAVLGALDDKIVVNERIATTADSMCDLIFQSRAQQHTSVPMSQLLQPILGGTPDRKNESYWGGIIPWASAKDVVNATVGVVTSTEEYITEAATQNSRAKTMRPGSVVLTARGTVGAVARLAVPSAINQSCYAFEPGRVPAAVLFHMVRSASESMLGMAHGTVFSTVNMKTFDHVEIPDLPADVLETLNGDLASLHQLIVSHLRESRQLVTLRDTLLPQLMSGRLRVKDAEKIVEDAT